MKVPLILPGLALFGIVAAAEPDVPALETRASAGDAAAQNNLGALYQAGDGVAKDLKKALALYERAAAAGHAVAAYNLAFMYDMGIEAPRDRKLANQWYQKAAEKGYAPAMLNLGMNVVSGEGAPQDIVEGLKWLDLARFFTQQERDMQVKWRIRGAYDAVKAKMTKQQVAEAEKRSKAWYEDYRAKQKKG